MLTARSEVSNLEYSATMRTRKLKLMWNEVPCAKLRKAKYDGRHFPSFTAKNDGDPKVCKLVDCAQPGVYWGTGSISKDCLIHGCRKTTDIVLARDYDIHGPAGPTAFWKESDDLEEEKESD